jgi:Tfp pilus assembly protein PilV
VRLNHASRANRLGMTLLEVLVSTTLLAVGIVATFKCLGAISVSQRRALESEEMQRLALQTYDKIIFQKTLPAGTVDGDFSDQGEHRFIWHAERQSTGIDNLDVLKVEVGPVGDGYQHAQKLQGLISQSGGASGS